MARPRKLGDNPLEALGRVTTAAESTWDRRHPTTAYRLPPEIRDKVKDAARAEGVPISQLAAYALAEWLARYERGEAELPTREVVRTSKAVVLPS